MKRLRLYDMRQSRLNTVIGVCKADIPQIAEAVNTSQQRLLYADEAGDEGWFGTFAEIAFTVNRSNPYWTAPRDIARLEGVNICDVPFDINNQFVEYLKFGNGRMPKLFRQCHTRVTEVFSRNIVPTFVDLSNPPQIIQVFFTDPSDVQAGKRAFLQGTDNNNIPIETQDGANQVHGVFVTAESPYVSPSMMMNSITGIQKDITAGQVKFYQMDPTTGTQVLLLTMEPTEETAAYRRYYFNNLPATCCPPIQLPVTTNQNLTVTAIAKLELIPVMTDTDYCLIQNKEALIEEAESVRYSGMDLPNALQMSAAHHKTAIRLLRGEMAHYLGIDEPAIDFAPFGSARLQRLKIGTMI